MSSKSERNDIIMLSKAVSLLAYPVLLISFVGLQDLAEAQSRDSNPVPRLETYETESVRNEFFTRLKDHRSVEYRKESAIKEYSRLEKILNDFRQRKEKTDSEIEALRSQYESATIIPAVESYRIARLDSQRNQMSRLIKSARFQMDLLVEEYDLLSRQEEIGKGYKTKQIPKVDYISETSRVREELFQLRLIRHLDQLETGLAEGLGRIERTLESLKQSR